MEKLPQFQATTRALLADVLFSILALTVVPFLSIWASIVLLSILRPPGSSALPYDFDEVLLVAIAGVSFALASVVVIWGYVRSSRGVPFATLLFVAAATRSLGFLLGGWLRALGGQGRSYFLEVIRERYLGGGVAIAMFAFSLPLSVFMIVSASPEGCCNPRRSRAIFDVRDLARAIARVRMDTGSTNLNCLLRLENLASPKPPAGCGAHLPLCADAIPGYACWGGPYQAAVTNDPWNHPYLITASSDLSAITVTSLGSDGLWDERRGEHDGIRYTLQMPRSE